MNKNICNVGLCGLTFDSENNGCSALAYSFAYSLLEKAEKLNLKIKLFIISPSKNKDIFLEYNANLVGIEVIDYHFKSLLSHYKISEAVKKFDIIFDFTEGDSFTDIYGEKRLISNFWLKAKLCQNKSILILGPQTYGPFKNRINQWIASKILKKIDYIYSRDDISAEYVYSISKRKIKTSTDVAFNLPYSKLEKEGLFNIGINVSGLLWNNGYTRKNEFGLKVDYNKFINDLIEYLFKKFPDRNLKINLIPHVICNDYYAIENDLKACEDVANRNSHCVILRDFKTPMEAKSYISKMDIFIGARMHATIAAFSSYVPVIPFSYSRKFEGVFNSLNYYYCINGRNLTTDEAISKTLLYVDNYETLKRDVISGMKIASQRLKIFSDDLEKILSRTTNF